MLVERPKVLRRARKPLAAAVAVALLGAVLLWRGDLLGGKVRADPVFQFLFAAAVVLLAAHLVGGIFARLRQPLVLGEILAGVMLGPSVLGLLWPGGAGWLFPDSVQHVFGFISQLGLVIYAFLIGSELRTRQLRERKRLIAGVVGGGMALPMVMGVGIALLARPMLAGPDSNTLAYALFIGLALAITALPVLARILGDLGLDGTPLGSLAMACAAIGDGIGWTLLAVITMLAGAGGVGGLSLMIELIVAFLAVGILVIRPFVHRVAKRAERSGNTHLLLPTLFGGALAFGATTQLIGLHAASGGFLFGALAPRRSAVVDKLNHQMETFTLKVLLPVFFVGVGLSVDLTQLASDPSRWLLFAGLLVAAFVAKLVGAGFGARLAGCTRGQSFTLGALMNCRGVTELIVVNIGWQAHLISQFALTSFVLIALVTSLVTPWLARAPRVDLGCAGELSDDRIWQLLTEHAEKVPNHDR